MTPDRQAIEIYAPRPVTFKGVRHFAGFRVKLYSILAPGREADGVTIDAAAGTVATCLDSTIMNAPDIRLGFAILHFGEHANWLVFVRWVYGDSLKSILFRSESDRAPAFQRVSDPDLFACVWEAGIIDFERRAFIQTMMTTAPDESRYLKTVLNGEV